MFIFSGKYLYTVDTKCRINIPAAYRRPVGDKSSSVFHVTLGPNECLVVYPQQFFTDFAIKLDREYGSLATEDEKRRYFLETMGNAQPSRCDQQGRIIVPKEHLEYAKIDKEVMIIGAVNKFEFWNPEIFNQFIKGSPISSKERVKRYGGVDRT